MLKSIRSFWKRNGMEKLGNKMVSGFLEGACPFKERLLNMVPRYLPCEKLPAL
jgi:hypothetical protein